LAESVRGAIDRGEGLSDAAGGESLLARSILRMFFVATSEECSGQADVREIGGDSEVLCMVSEVGIAFKIQRLERLPWYLSCACLGGSDVKAGPAEWAVLNFARATLAIFATVEQTKNALTFDWLRNRKFTDKDSPSKTKSTSRYQRRSSIYGNVNEQMKTEAVVRHDLCGSELSVWVLVDMLWMSSCGAADLEILSEAPRHGSEKPDAVQLRTHSRVLRNAILKTIHMWHCVRLCCDEDIFCSLEADEFILLASELELVTARSGTILGEQDAMSNNFFLPLAGDLDCEEAPSNVPKKASISPALNAFAAIDFDAIIEEEEEVEDGDEAGEVMQSVESASVWASGNSFASSQEEDGWVGGGGTAMSSSASPSKKQGRVRLSRLLYTRDDGTASANWDDFLKVRCHTDVIGFRLSPACFSRHFAKHAAFIFFILNTYPERLANLTETLRFRENDVVTREGDKAESMYFITKGLCRASRKNKPMSRPSSLMGKAASLWEDEEDEEAVGEKSGEGFNAAEEGNARLEDDLELGSLHAGDIFGEIGMQFCVRRMCTVMAETDVVCAHLKRDDYRDVMTAMRVYLTAAKDSLVQELEELPWIKRFSADEKLALDSAITPVRFNAGEYIARQGHFKPAVTTIVSGRVMLTRWVGDQLKVLSIEESGTHPLLGQYVQVDGPTRWAENILALTPTVAIRFSVHDILRIVGSLKSTIQRNILTPLGTGRADTEDGTQRLRELSTSHKFTRHRRASWAMELMGQDLGSLVTLQELLDQEEGNVVHAEQFDGGDSVGAEDVVIEGDGFRTPPGRKSTKHSHLSVESEIALDHLNILSPESESDSEDDDEESQEDGPSESWNVGDV